jgi:2'-phosphotransferase
MFNSTQSTFLRSSNSHIFNFQIDLDLQEITDPSTCPVVVHGTWFKCWDSILLKGLSRMSRNHIHFAAGEPGTLGTISGMRKNAEIYIYIDLPTALKGNLLVHFTSDP